MKNLVPKPITNFNLYIFLTVCSIFLGIPIGVLSQTIDYPDKIENTSSSTPLFSQRNGQEAELDAFFRSKYNYCDAQLLSDFWGQSLVESKARIGRKVLWGDGGIPYLEQFLVDARIQAIKQDGRPCTYGDAGYTYDDAVALARFWGDPSPWEAKQRIESNLVLGKKDVVDSALRKAVVSDLQF